jgi:predicted transposase YdaD
VAALEIPARELRVDTLIRLRDRRGEIYFRHVEFQARWRPGFERRMFDYNTRLNAWLRRPVLTTVLWVFPPGPRGEPVYRVRHRGREVNRWRYDSVCLWQIEAERALQGAPGLAALVPLLHGGTQSDSLVQAARRIERVARADEQRDLLGILSVLAGRMYTVEELAALVGRRAMIESSVWNEAVRRGRVQGRTEGRTEGTLAEDRRLCLDMVREYHPRLLSRLRATIQACTDGKRLRTWILRAPRLSDADFVGLILGEGH